jgi:hypothetical protein
MLGDEKAVFNGYLAQHIANIVRIVVFVKMIVSIIYLLQSTLESM